MMVKGLIGKELVDCIVMDIKAPCDWEKYSKAIGINADKLLGKVKETVGILSLRQVMNSGPPYFLHSTKMRTQKKEYRSIKGCKKHVLQKFNAGLGKKTLDLDFSKLKPFMDEQMRKFLAAAQKLLVNNKGKINLCLSETCFGVNDDWT